ncbi:MAG TPA: DUF411 domain-containing protein, partial [Longimicrobium sp.]|nr:DUF411 domain-containing protein [Longimicrobium sp.]
AALATAGAACGGSSGEAAPKAAAPAAPAAQAPPAAPAAASAPQLVVYKDPSCGCCSKWVEHMRDNGFPVEAHDTAGVDGIKDRAGVPLAARSCHTGLVGGYAIEGHVPAEVVRRLLREHPADVAGLAVPGMVTGSPGMEGGTPQHYDVIAFTRDGRTSVYEKR